MSLSSSQFFTRSNYFSIVFAAIPVSFIAGNMIININIGLLILSAIVIYKKEIFDQKFYLIDKLLILFFTALLITSIYNNLYLYFYHEDTFQKSFDIIYKSIGYLRFLLLYLIIRFLVEREIIKFKLFFLSCFIFTIFVSLDLFYQLKFGVDIFGYEKTGRKLSGPFKDELIAGSYLQRFSLFSFFLLPIFFKNKTKNIYKFIIPLIFLIFFSAIIISGNRMPLVLFVLSILTVIIFEKETRKYLLVFVSIFSIIFFLIFKYNITVQKNFLSFYNQIENITKVIFKKDDLKTVPVPQYYKEFSTFYDTWLINKYIGGGIKSFRYYCHTRPNINKNSEFICNMHPHNYYLEILTETGIVGFVILAIIFFLVLYLSFIKKYLIKSPSLKYNHLMTPFMILFLIEIFPIKSTGSFFTTGNATYIFLIMSVTIALMRKKDLN